MKRTQHHPIGCLVAIAAILLSGAGCRPADPVPDPVPDPSVDEAAIRGVLDAIATDFNAGRIEDMLSRYQDDVIVSAPGAPDTHGRAAWRETLATSLPAGVPMTLRFDTEEIAIDGSLAYERGTYVLEVAAPDGAAPPMKIGGRHIHIFRRQGDGSWKGWRLMENSADPATAPTAAVAPR